MNNKQDLPWDNPRFRNWVAVARACHAVERAVAAALAPLHLKPAQLDVLMNLYRHPGMSQHELARKLLRGEVKDSRKVVVDYRDQGLVFEVK